MKKRLALISNSSSASFILQKSKMTDEQIDAIRKLKYADSSPDANAPEKLHYAIKLEYDYWVIDEDAEFIRGSTFMDNDDMDKVFAQINLDPKAIVDRSDE